VTVEAAGAVVWRGDEVLVIHRPKYDDWSLPKGKLEPGETTEEAALRELAEETGLRGQLDGPSFADVAYTDQHGRPKVVHYFVVRDPEGGFRPNHEVDEVRWLSLEDACGLLSRPADADVVRASRSR
jgi:8-oxo-dGTP diphosphatase